MLTTIACLVGLFHSCFINFSRWDSQIFNSFHTIDDDDDDLDSFIRSFSCLRCISYLLLLHHYYHHRLHYRQRILWIIGIIIVLETSISYWIGNVFNEFLDLPRNKIHEPLTVDDERRMLKYQHIFQIDKFLWTF